MMYWKAATSSVLALAFASLASPAMACCGENNMLEQEGTYNLGSEKPSSSNIAQLELEQRRLELEYETNINGPINGDFFLNGDQIDKLGNQVNTTTIGQQKTIDASGDNNSIATDQETRDSELGANTETGQTLFQATGHPSPSN
jgi:hypothetical protein